MFLLRQYMLTIPDELIEAARVDAASDSDILAHHSAACSTGVGRVGDLLIAMAGNDFLWPLIVLRAATTSPFRLD